MKSEVHGLRVCHDRGRLLFLSPPQTRRLRVQVPLCGIDTNDSPLGSKFWWFPVEPSAHESFGTCYFCSSLTSDLLLQAEDHRHGLMQHQQLGLRLLALQMQLTHVTQLLEGLVDVPHAQAFAGVVGHPPLTLALGLLLRAQILVFVDAATSATSVRFSWDHSFLLNIDSSTKS